MGNVRLSAGLARRLVALLLSPLAWFLVGWFVVSQNQVATALMIQSNTLRWQAPPHRRTRQFIKASQLSMSSNDDERAASPIFDNVKESTTTANRGEGTDEEEAAVPAPTTATGTVNQRLLVELQEAEDREKYGLRSSLSTKAATIFGSQRKTDAERQQAIAEAKDLNGVNPVTAFVGSAVALAGAFVFWELTQFLAEYFALHPTGDDQAYFVARLNAVVRNIAIGLAALASGFFGVTGMGILSLGVRVAYGVATGELDPTPKARDTEKADTKVEMGKIWKLMTNQSKKRGQR